MYVTEEEMDKINKILYTVFIYLFFYQTGQRKLPQVYPIMASPRELPLLLARSTVGSLNVPWTGITTCRSMV